MYDDQGGQTRISHKRQTAAISLSTVTMYDDQGGQRRISQVTNSYRWRQHHQIITLVVAHSHCT